uniref:GTPase HflX n=1 Tax=Candidatus Limnocylindrus sp. TaxID=2802978 RepID=UPI004049CE3B
MTKRTAPIDLTPTPERAFLIAVDTGSDVGWPAEDSLQELASLARTAGAEVVGAEWQQRRHPDPDTYIGAGKAQELLAAKVETGFTVLIADDELSPTQQRGLEEALGVKVIDRSRLILDIFALHARTREGRLQVELAQLEYQLPRLTKLWTHLSRTGGGIGTRGPGESQLETDRRLIRDRISVMKARVDQVRRSRETGAKSRTTRGEPTVAIVGYTNAGKSTLLNSLVGSSVVLAEDRLFATLDPTSRRVRLPSGLHAIVTDTVGFIHKLPHQLVDAFRATLEEVSRADLLLEVVDASDHHALEHRATVQAVLDELGAAEKPRIIAANKIDAAQMHPREIDPAALGVSAATGLGLGPLRSAIEEALQRQGTPVDLRLPYTAVGEVEAIRARGGIQVAYDEDALHVTGFATAEMASELKRLKRNSTAKLL